MADLFVDECLEVLTRTPDAIRALLNGLPDRWVRESEAPGCWSPYVVIGHLLHCEKVDWMPRLGIILEHGVAKTFEPFDREAQFAEPERSLAVVLDEWVALRSANLARLRAMDLQTSQLEAEGMHPGLGRVTLRQLLATWTAHDLAHLLQISRTMAKRLKSDVGPWAEYLSVMK